MAGKSLLYGAERMRVYIGESDRWRGKPLYTALLEALQAQGMAGATVMRGVAGFGAHSRIHNAAILQSAEDLPLVIDVVDRPEKIAQALEVIGPMVREGLITVESVRVVKYTHRYLNPLPADRTVEEAMTRDVLTLSPESLVHTAWAKMLENQIKVIPITNVDGQVVGILTDQDLLERAGVQQRLAVARRMDAALIREELRRLEQSRLTVGEVMSHPVITTQADEALGSAAARMISAGMKRLPVVDANQRLVGMLSRLDVLRQVTDISQAQLSQPVMAKAARTLRDVMRSEVPSAHTEDDLSALIDKFIAAGTTRLIVVDDQGRAVGLISDSDLVARLQPARQRGLLQAFHQRAKVPVNGETARELMSPGPLTAPPDLPVVEGVRRMLAEGRKWLVVVDAEVHPLGLVDRQVLMEALTASYEE